MADIQNNPLFKPDAKAQLFQPQPQQGGGITRVGNNFLMDGQVFDLETLLMSLQFERAENIELQLVDQANDMKRKNDLLAQANKALAAARQARPTNDKDVTGEPAEYTQFIEAQGIQRDTTGNDKAHNQAEWDKNIEHLKAFIDTLNSQSQLDMIRLQSLTNKENQSFELMTNVMTKFAKTRDTVVANLR